MRTEIGIRVRDCRGGLWATLLGVVMVWVALALNPAL